MKLLYSQVRYLEPNRQYSSSNLSSVEGFFFSTERSQIKLVKVLIAQKVLSENIRGHYLYYYTKRGSSSEGSSFWKDGSLHYIGSSWPLSEDSWSEFPPLCLESSQWSLPSDIFSADTLMGWKGKPPNNHWQYFQLKLPWAMLTWIEQTSEIELCDASIGILLMKFMTNMPYLK